MVSSNHVINPFIYKRVPFDAIKDITPISVIASSAVVLVVNPDIVKAKTTREFIAELKANPEALSLRIGRQRDRAASGCGVLHKRSRC